jgi:hypothetical protein
MDSAFLGSQISAPKGGPRVGVTRQQAHEHLGHQLTAHGSEAEPLFEYRNARARLSTTAILTPTATSD